MTRQNVSDRTAAEWRAEDAAAIDALMGRVAWRAWRIAEDTKRVAWPIRVVVNA